MDTHLKVDKVHIMEWLEPGDYRTGRELFDVIEPIGLTSQRNIDVALHRIRSRADFAPVLRSIEAEFRASGKFPFLQIETHGIYLHDPEEKVADGIGSSLGDMLSWDELAAELLPLNQATGLRLGIMTASCSGIWGIRAVQVVDRAPFLAIIGPNRKLNAGEVIDSSRAFYTTILAGATGDAALHAMNDAVAAPANGSAGKDVTIGTDVSRPPTFGAYNCEKLFRDVVQGYLDRCSSEGFQAARVKKLVGKMHLRSWAERGRYLSPEETSRAYEAATEYLNDQPARFEQLRREFFMIDLFPENDRRFSLYLEAVA